MFLAEDENGNQFIVKVDDWEDGVKDPAAPEAQYAAVEAYLASQGIEATVIDHAIKAGSYQGNSGGGIFLSDGSRVPQSDIHDVENGEPVYWFGEFWSGKAFNDPGNDLDNYFEVDFDNLPEPEGSGDNDSQAKALVGDDVDNDQASDSWSDRSETETDSDDDPDTGLIVEPYGDDRLPSLADPGVESIDLPYPDESDSDASVSDDITAETQVDFDFDDSKVVMRRVSLWM